MSVTGKFRPVFFLFAAGFCRETSVPDKFSDGQVKFSDDHNFPTVMIFHLKMGPGFLPEMGPDFFTRKWVLIFSPEMGLDFSPEMGLDFFNRDGS